MSKQKLKMTFSATQVPPHGIKDVETISLNPEGPEFSIDDAASVVKSEVGDSAVLSVEKEHAGSPYMLVDPAQIKSIIKTLRDNDKTRMVSLQVVSAVDFLDKNLDGEDQEPRVEVFYVLYSYAFKTQVCVKAKLPRDDSKIDSVADLFRSANWYERECYDLLGVVFEGHPHLERILLAPDWKGHPLKRDYVFPEEYNGMKVPL